MNSTLIKNIVHQDVLFITTKNLEYIRNSQEINFLKKYASTVTVIGSASSSYPKRLLYVWSKLLFSSLKKYSVIFIGFAPQLCVPLFFWKFRKHFIIEDFFISFFDTLIYDRQLFSSKSFLAHLLHWLDNFTLSFANLIICDTQAHGHYFVTEFNRTKAPMETLYLKADTSIYYPMQSEPHSTFRVLYFGSILPLQGISIILDAIRKLDMIPDIEFYIIGPIPSSVSKPLNPNIHYINWLSQEQLAREIASSDLCLAGHFHPSIQKAFRTIPGKAYIYEAMGKPMILGDNPATRELEHRWKVPAFYVPMGNPDLLAKCILSYFKSVYIPNKKE